MKETLTTFFEQVSNTSPATRGVLALAGLVLAASVGVVSYQANQTEFTLLITVTFESLVNQRCVHPCEFRSDLCCSFVLDK